MEAHELLEALKSLIAEQPGVLESLVNDNRTRTLPGRQLHDLRLLPTAKDARPLFLPSAETPRDFVDRQLPYPKLLWRPDGTELTVKDRKQHDAMLAEGCLELCPTSRVLTPQERLEDLLAQLSPEDRELVIEQQRKTRLDAIQAQLAQLSPDELMAVTGEAPKRKPGRPPKAQIA